MTQIGIHLRAYNWTMVNRRNAMRLTQAQLGEIIGKTQAWVSEVELLKRVPTHDQMDDIASALGSSVVDLFPDDLIELMREKPQTSISFALPIEQLSLLGAEASALPSPEDAYLARERAEGIRAVVDSLDDRERTCIILRFGLDGEPSRTLDEVGRSLGVGRERVRQIEAEALRRLRHPSRISY